jgi:uncharacterized protein YndB with AHSA1/START domain
VTVLDDRVEQEVTIAAPRTLVWEFFTDADRLVQWKGTSAVLDPRPGGVYRCVISDQAVVVGEYLSVSPYDEVSFSWGLGRRPAGAAGEQHRDRDPHRRAGGHVRAAGAHRPPAPTARSP